MWLSNRGIRISAIVQHLKEAPKEVALNPLVQALFNPAYTDSRPFSTMALDGTLKLPGMWPERTPGRGSGA